MNKNQRKLLNECAQRLEQLECELSSVVSYIEDVKNEEECKLDNLPESLRYSQRGEEIEEGVDKLEEILDLLEDGDFSEAADILGSF